MIPLPCDLPNRIAGVDFSEYQPIDTPWGPIRASGAVYVAIRVSSGVDYADSRAAEHARRAADGGMLVDFYHFLHSNENAKLQAEWCARRIEKMPIRHGRRAWCDWEDMARMKLVGPARALAACIAFCDRLDELVPGEAAIYTGPSVMSYIVAGTNIQLVQPLARRSLEVAHYRFDQATGYDYGLEKPTIPLPWTSAVGWQWCGDHGPRIAGVPFDCDRDVVFGTRDDFDNWFACAPNVEPLATQPSTTAEPIGVQDRAESDASDSSDSTPPKP